LIQRVLLGPGELENMPDMSAIDWSSVNWTYIATLTVVVFFSTLIGSLLSFKRATSAALLSALLFAMAFVYLTYYPHGWSLPTFSTVNKASEAPNGRRGNLDMF
jgi:hypothetical protein